MITKIIAYTDGACSPNPGIGGFGCVVDVTDSDNKEYRFEYFNYKEETTNNEMELMSFISAIKNIDSIANRLEISNPCIIEIITDSQYCANSVNLGWLKNWHAKNYNFQGGKRPNYKLWKEVYNWLVSRNYGVQIKWVKGHACTEGNQRADELAVQARLERREMGPKLITK